MPMGITTEKDNAVQVIQHTLLEEKNLLVKGDNRAKVNICKGKVFVKLKGLLQL